jgi:hypothetical protein
VDDWLERYRKLWEQRLDRLEEYLHELQAQESKETRKDAKTETRRGRKK